MDEQDDKRSRDQDGEEIPSGLAQEGWESPPLGGDEDDAEGEGETPRGEDAMPGIPTEGEPDSSA